MKKRTTVAVVAVLALVLAACGPGGTDTTTTVQQTTTTAAQTTTTADPRADWPTQLVFGFVPSREAEELQDRVDVLATILEEALDIDVVGLVTTDYPSLGLAMGNNQVQLGALPPLGYVTAAHNFGDVIELFAQSERRGSLFYHTQYFTNDPTVCDGDPEEGAFQHDADGNIVPAGPTEVAAQQVGWNADGTREAGVDAGLRCPMPVDLSVVAGKTFAFVTPGSASGYLFPLGEMIAAGVTGGMFTEMYGGSHDGAVTAVYNGDADFGASFDDARRNIRETTPDVGSKVIVFNISKPIPNDVIAIRSDLPDSLKDAIFEALAAYIATEEGLALMDEIYSWTGLVRAGPQTETGMEIIRAAAEEAGILD
jgi:phosphonate transport system substrate-binding protein